MKSKHLPKLTSTQAEEDAARAKLEAEDLKTQVRKPLKLKLKVPMVQKADAETLAGGAGHPTMPAANDSQKNYVVGYGRPPVETQFQPGISGNPTGRPKGSINTETVLKKICAELIIIQENGQLVEISKMEAMCKMLMNKSIKGNVNAIRLIFEILKYYEEKYDRGAHMRHIKAQFPGIFKDLES